MIEIEVKKNKYAYNVYHLVKAFFPGEEVTQKVDGKQESPVVIRMPEGSCFCVAAEGAEDPAAADSAGRGRNAEISAQKDDRGIQQEKRDVTRQEESWHGEC